MKHVIYPERTNDDGETEPAVVVDVPDTLYLQVVDVDDCEDWPAPSEPDERTHCDERINASDVAYVPLFRAERAEALARKLDELAREHGLADGAALIDALNEGRILTVGRRDVHDRITGVLDVERALRVRAERAEAEAEALRARLDAAQEAAHMPDDWPHGLPSWIAQRLYAAYIGAAFSPDVMEQIRAGRLTFPEAPIYAERDALRAQLDALPALPIRIEARCCHCDKPARIVRTYYDSGFPSAREHLCPEHADNHPWHGDAIPPVPRPKPGSGWSDTAPAPGGEEAG